MFAILNISNIKFNVSLVEKHLFEIKIFDLCNIFSLCLAPLDKLELVLEDQEVRSNETKMVKNETNN